jgi:hypothetical protein
MKWLLALLCVLSVAIVIAGVLILVYHDETKAIIDQYANLASVLGLFVSLVGFILTVSAVFETLRVSKQARQEIQKAAAEARKETKLTLDKIRLRMMEDTCEHAFLAASDARKAIRSSDWLRAIERCQEARRLASRLVAFGDLTEIERTLIRKAIDELKATISFIERNRLKPEPAQGLPDKALQPIDSLIDELDKVRGRLQHKVLEASHVDESTN